jgi:cytochrome c oxidase subunit IV
MEPHRITARAHWLTWLALMVLSGLTLGLSFLPLGAMHGPVALAIAAVKVVLIVLIFMHLLEQRLSNAFALIFCVLMLLLLVSLTAADVATRREPPTPNPSGLLIAPGGD